MFDRCLLVFTTKTLSKNLYKCIKNLSNSGHGVEWETFTCMAKDGTIGGLWAAAESCFKQAQLALEDWHIYIEDFTVLDDGNLELVTGS